MSSHEELDAVYVDEKVAEYIDKILDATHAPEKIGLERLMVALAGGALPWSWVKAPRPRNWESKG